MYKIKFYFILLIGTIALNSCHKDDDLEPPVPPRPFADQYPKDIDLIESYLKSNYIEVIQAPGETRDQDVIIAKLDAEHPVSIKDQKVYTLQNRVVKLHGIEYVLHYLILREGKGESPCNVDGVLAAYKGQYLSTVPDSNAPTSTFFDELKIPDGFINLYTNIRGWKEIFPQLKAGTYESNTNGTVTYNDFGAAVMFLPSGLAYYNTPYKSVPAYSPVVFNIKLYGIMRLDHESYTVLDENQKQVQISAPDGVKSFQEDDGDGYMWTKSELDTGVTKNPDDSDGDGIPDFLDRDDDGDGYATQGEVKNDKGEIYPFDLIPDCDGKATTVRLKKRYLDANCHKMNQ